MKQANTIYRIILTAVSLYVLVSGCIQSPVFKPSIKTETSKKYHVRVQLYKKLNKCNLKIHCDFKIINNETGTVTKATKTKRPLQIESDGKSFKIADRHFNTKTLIIEPEKDCVFTINKHRYRGSLKLIINSDKKTFMAVNHLPMEAYLYGVVAAEMPSYWEKQALKAQAIAARTYCFYIKSKFGAHRSWDVKATQANQVYKGIAAETSTTKEAVNSTFGMILCSNNDSGICQSFPAYYSSTCGGHTENSKNVFGDSFDALAGVECPYCKKTTRPSLFFWPTAKFKKTDADKKLIKKYPSLKKMEGIRKIVVSKESNYGNFKRATGIKIIGKNGKTDFIRAEDLRLTIDPTGAKIQSTACKIVNLKNEYMFVGGRGFGHGTGLCQYGAREMARQGKTAQQILKFYYPDSRIKILY